LSCIIDNVFDALMTDFYFMIVFGYNRSASLLSLLNLVEGE